MSEPRGEGRHVQSGTFRVDRDVAIQKLRAFRDPRAGPVMFWVRAASAAGARWCQIDERRDRLSVAFNGRPLTREQLNDPYGVSSRSWAASSGWPATFRRRPFGAPGRGA